MAYAIRLPVREAMRRAMRIGTCMYVVYERMYSVVMAYEYVL